MPAGWTLEEWREGYGRGRLTLAALKEEWRQLDATDPAWISIVSEEELDRQLLALEKLIADRGSASLPLLGVPFAVKDNIDVLGLATTAACRAFAYEPTADAPVVAALRNAGAVVFGKTNLDQFATGLVGTRSPYGIVRNIFDPEFIAGGSSSGSASLVARGIVPFALGTDTAGSGRVPAAFGNIVGLKPTRGLLSTRGVVPACRTLDCVSIFALTVENAQFVADCCGGYDELDPYARSRPARELPLKGEAQLGLRGRRLLVPDLLEFCGDNLAAAAFEQALHTLRTLGAELATVDFAPFNKLARLLYEGPWVAERWLTVAEVAQEEKASVDPVVGAIVAGALRFTAADAFRWEYRRAALARQIQIALDGADALVVPTTPTIYRIADVTAEPLTTNSSLGTYTNFTNLADLSALALPAGFRADGLPAGLTLLSHAFGDAALANLGASIQRGFALPLGATQRPYPFTHQDKLAGLPAVGGAAEAHTMSGEPRARVLLAVVGAHLTGMPLNHQLTDLDGRFVSETKTSANYRLYALPNTTPPKPGMLRSSPGQSILVEVWELGVAEFGQFVAQIPSPLSIGRIELVDGTTVQGFLCEPHAREGAEDITHFGGFRAFIATKTGKSGP